MQQNSENFHFIVAVSICSVWSILDSVLGTRPSIMAETVPPGCAAYSSLSPFCQCSSLRNMFGRKGSARQKRCFSSLPCCVVLLAVQQQNNSWLVCILPFPEICSAPQQAPAHPSMRQWWDLKGFCFLALVSLDGPACNFLFWDKYGDTGNTSFDDFTVCVWLGRRLPVFCSCFLPSPCPVNSSL